MPKQVQHDRRGEAKPGREIMPVRILAFDKVYFPLAMPALHLLLPRDGRGHVIKKLEADEMMDGIALGEAVNRISAVMPKAGN